MSLESNIALIRNGRSYAKFAEWLNQEGVNIDQSNISKYEKGKVKPTTDFYLALAKKGYDINSVLMGVARLVDGNITMSPELADYIESKVNEAVKKKKGAKRRKSEKEDSQWR